MFLKDYITAVASRAKLDENGTDDKGNSIRSLLKRSINQSHKEIAQNFDWPFLLRYGDLITVPNYATGTVNITNGSNTVTGNGASFTAIMQGRYFKPSTGSNWYKIAYVDVTNQQLILEAPMIEASLNGGTYTIWKRFYYVKSEVDRIYDFENWIKNGVLLNQSIRDVQDITVNVSNTGSPDFFSPYGVNPIESSYTTGTVSVPLNSNVLTGVGTAFLANVDAGDMVSIGNSIFRVKRVESDTRIILYNFSDVDLSTTQTYTISKDNPVGFQLYYSPDKQYIFPYTYIKRVYDMINESKDTSDFPEKFDLAIIDGALMHVFEYQNDDKRKQLKEAEFSGRIRDLKRMSYISKPRFRQFKPFIPSRSGYGINRIP